MARHTVTIDKRRALRTLFLSVVTLLPTGALAQAGDAFAPFVRDPARPEVLRLDGEINARTPFMLNAVLRAHPDLTTLELHSPGGDVYQALSMVDAIRGAGLDTRIARGDRCHSACSFLFFAGKERTAEGGLGVHQLLAANQQSAQFVMNDVLDVLAVLAVPDDVRRRMFQTPADQMYVFSPAEIDALGFGAAQVVTEAAADVAPSAQEATVPEATGMAARNPAQGDEAGPAQTVLTVRADGAGGFSSLTAAVAAAPENARIEVHPGRYFGPVEVTRAVDIVGVGARDEIVVEAANGAALRWGAGFGTVSGLTFRHSGSGPVGSIGGTVDIRLGVPVFRDNAISAAREAEYAAIRVSGQSAAPRIVGNTIQDAGIGILMESKAGGLIESNAFGDVAIGVRVVAGTPLVLRNRFRGIDYGVQVREAGGGVLRENSFVGCSWGIGLRDGADPTLEDNDFASCWGTVRLE